MKEHFRDGKITSSGIHGTKILGSSEKSPQVKKNDRTSTAEQVAKKVRVKPHAIKKVKKRFLRFYFNKKVI